MPYPLGHERKASPAGFEPATRRVETASSGSTEVRGESSLERDSDPRAPAYETSALPSELPSVTHAWRDSNPRPPHP